MKALLKYAPGHGHVAVREVPTIPGWAPRLFSGAIDGGMRNGIPDEDWGAVVTVYGDGGQVTGDFYDISDIHTQTIFEWCFGMVWAQPELDLKTKEIVVLTTMAAQDQPAEFEWHVRSALNLGIAREEIIAIIVQCTPYIGLPKANHMFMASTLWPRPSAVTPPR